LALLWVIKLSEKFLLGLGERLSREELFFVQS